MTTQKFKPNVGQTVDSNQKPPAVDTPPLTVVNRDGTEVAHEPDNPMHQDVCPALIHATVISSDHCHGRMTFGSGTSIEPQSITQFT